MRLIEMANKSGECFTPSSLWAELRKVKSEKVILLITKKNPYDIYSVSVFEVREK